MSKFVFVTTIKGYEKNLEGFIQAIGGSLIEMEVERSTTSINGEPVWFIRLETDPITRIYVESICDCSVSVSDGVEYLVPASCLTGKI